MTISRRAAVGGLLAAPMILRSAASRAADARVLKISHQFPGGTVDSGDFRDRLVRRFAAAVTEKTGGSLTFEIYPGSSLMKTVAQFSALRRGALDLTHVPARLCRRRGAGGQCRADAVPGDALPAGAGVEGAPIGDELTAVLDKRGVKILTWVWQGGGIASRAGAVVKPDDTKGLKIRGGSREMDLMLKAAGGIISSVTSDETYAAMQTGSLDAAVTSSTSLISFRLQEIAKNVTTARGGSFWFMFEPLLMSKTVFDSLTPDQQKAMTEVGTAQEPFALEMAKADDQALADIYGKAGVKVQDMTPDDIAKWKAIAQDSAWKDYAARNAACANMLKLAEAVA